MEEILELYLDQIYQQEWAEIHESYDELSEEADNYVDLNLAISGYTDEVILHGNLLRIEGLPGFVSKKSLETRHKVAIAWAVFTQKEIQVFKPRTAVELLVEAESLRDDPEGYVSFLNNVAKWYVEDLNKRWTPFD